MMQKETTCPYCGVGCGLDVSVDKDGSVPLVLASKSHPANLGRICSKGSALAETLDKAYSPKRLTHPLLNGEVVSWDSATTEIAKRFRDTIDEFGPNSVAFYLSGQLLTEDYYVANKLAKGFLGTANVDTNSRLCMSSAVAAYKRAFGSDTVPCCYEDLELADLIIMIGSNAAWTHPVLYQRIVAAKELNPNMKVVLIDPRRTATADVADLHLAITPSSDNFLFQGLLAHLLRTDHVDRDFVNRRTVGFDDVVESVRSASLESVAIRCGVNIEDLEKFYHWFAKTKKTISFYSQGINQSASGTDKCNSIINCHLATGKIGYAGAGPFSITGQPNAMGGREVGGLSNMLAAHMEFDDRSVDIVQRFWQGSCMATEPGLKAVDLFHAVKQGDVKLIWIIATNPAVSLPDSTAISEALNACETVIVSDITENDTTAYADILLPAEGWSEKDGTVTNSERTISRQRGFVKACGLAKPDWWALSRVAEKLGFESSFNFQCSAEIFREHAGLSAFENEGGRDFDLSGLSQISDQEYEDLKPVQWPVNGLNPVGTKRMFSDHRFFTPSGKAQFIVSKAVLAQAVVQAQEVDNFLLNTGRLRDQWHTMTRTGCAPKLTSHDDVAYVQIHPEDALRLGIQLNSIVRVFSGQGELALQAKISNSIPRGQLFIPIHWSDAFSSSGIANRLVLPRMDAVSGQPEFKASNVSIEPLEHRKWARIVTRRPIRFLERFDYWSVNQFSEGWVTLLGFDDSRDWRSELLELNSEFDRSSGRIDFLEFKNPFKKTYSAITYSDQEIDMLMFEHGCASSLPSLAWLVDAFLGGVTSEPANLVRGELGARDELVCSCFGTTRKRINQAIEEGASSQLELAEIFGCGSKCGSCKPEINQLFKT